MNKVHELALVRIEPLERWRNRLLVNLGIIHNYEEDEDEDNSKVDEIHEHGFNEIDDSCDDAYLRALDPRRWKEQDHYRVLGLKKKRFFATDDEIRKQYRKSVLLHHPDKRYGHSIVDADSDYFSCITKAYEILSDSNKRRSYDSADPLFNDDIPLSKLKQGEDFYKAYGKVFRRNSRWSTVQPVPDLGNKNSKREYVESFYSFWYNFDSWREFSYLDEEETEKGQNRDERRWMEKQNKVMRKEKKKEETQRIRQLVDQAYVIDPRVIYFKEQDKQRKLDIKREKDEAKQAKIREEIERERKQMEEEKARKEEEERQQKELIEKAKLEKEAQRKQKRIDRKFLETLLNQDNYFSTNETERINNIHEFEKLMHSFNFNDLSVFRKAIECKTIYDERKEYFFNEINKMNSNLNKGHVIISKSDNKGDSKENGITGKNKWNHDDLQLLIKAVNLFPAGKQNRWEVIAEFINQHTTSGIQRKARDVLGKAKDLQKLDPLIKNDVNQESVKKFLENKNAVVLKEDDTTSKRYDHEKVSDENKNKSSSVSPSSSSSTLANGDENDKKLNGTTETAPWSNDEQKLLEQALKTYKSDDPNRWDLIAGCLPNRSKKECINRYKELVLLIKAKKQAQEAVNKNKVKK